MRTSSILPTFRWADAVLNALLKLTAARRSLEPLNPWPLDDNSKKLGPDHCSFNAVCILGMD